MRYLLVMAWVVAGCSENPLDPDKKGCIQTSAGEICAGDDVPSGGGGPGGGGPGGGGEVPTCDQVCDKFVDCFGDQVDYQTCQTECGGNFTDENKRFVMQASCQQLAEALQGG